MKSIKRTVLALLLCTLILLTFTACHSHNPEWKIDKDRHWQECECGEISLEGEHSFELEICTVCGAERKTQDGAVTDIALFNEYGDWTQWLYFDAEGNYVYESSAEYTYDKNGNKLTDIIYDDGVVSSSGEYVYDSEGYTYKKYVTESYEDGTKCVYEYNEEGDSLGYILYDEEGSQLESYRSEYITDEKGNLTGEKVYIDDKLNKEMKYAAGKDGDEEYFYIKEETKFSEDGSKNTDIYDEEGYVIQQIAYDAEGKKLYTYDLEYFFDDEGNHVATEKRENGILREEEIHEYDKEGYLLSTKTYKEDKLSEELIYTVGENSSELDKKIIYNPDGTTTVKKYDENGEWIVAEE